MLLQLHSPHTRQPSEEPPPPPSLRVAHSPLLKHSHQTMEVLDSPQHHSMARSSWVPDQATHSKQPQPSTSTLLTLLAQRQTHKSMTTSPSVEALSTTHLLVPPHQVPECSPSPPQQAPPPPTRESLEVSPSEA